MAFIITYTIVITIYFINLLKILLLIMILIIDGYNVLFDLHCNLGGLTLEEKRNKLIKKTALYKTYNKIKRVIIVFDGKFNENIIFVDKKYYKGLEIIYAVEEGKADERIVNLSYELNDVCVVTKDRNLIRRVKQRNATIIQPRVFLNDLRNLNPKEHCEDKPKTFKIDTEKWLEIFQIDREINIPDDEDFDI